MKKILVTAKVYPDLDGTACALAYADLLNQSGQEAQALLFGGLQAETLYFVEKHGIQIPIGPDDGKGSWEGFVLVDASSMRGMPKVVSADKVVEIIDHREGEPEKQFPQAKIQNELVGAAATLVVERFQKEDKFPQPDHAKLLYGAISYNTLNFTTTNTTVRDHLAKDFLEERFGLSPKISKAMFIFAAQKILEDLYQAILEDGKSYGEKTDVAFYQLVFWEWGKKIAKRKREIEEAVRRVDDELGCQWSFLNIKDVKNKRSILYAPGEKAQAFLKEALDQKINFGEGWAVVPGTILRKQLAPKLTEFLARDSES